MKWIQNHLSLLTIFLILLNFLQLVPSIVFSESFYSIRQAHELFFSGSISNAISIYKKLDTPDKDQNIAIGYRTLGNFPNAIRYFKIALQHTPDNPDIISELAWTYYYNGDYKHSRKYFLKAIKLISDPVYILGLSLNYIQFKQYRKAIHILDNLIHINFKLPIVYLLKGDIYVLMKQYDNAFKHYQLSLKKARFYEEIQLKINTLSKLILKESKLYPKSIKKHVIKSAIKNLQTVKKLKEEISIFNPIISKATPVDSILEQSSPISIGLWSDYRGFPLNIEKLELILPKYGSIYVQRKLIYTMKKSTHITIKKNNQGMTLNDGEKQYQIVDNEHITFTSSIGGSIVIHSMESNNITHVNKRRKGREYRGSLKIYMRNNTMFMVNHLPIEVYLLGVISSEMPHSWGIEATSVQAILSRTYVQNKINRRHRKSHGVFDICDSQHCQVYYGVQKEHKNTNEAVKKTVQMMLFKNNTIIPVYYHSICGGSLQSTKHMYGWSSGNNGIGIDKMDHHGSQISLSPFQFSIWIKKAVKMNCNFSTTGNSPFRWIRTFPKKYLKQRLQSKIGNKKNFLYYSHQKKPIWKYQ